MTDEITPELFEHLVELAALEITPEEADYLQRELNNQLKPFTNWKLSPFQMTQKSPLMACSTPPNQPPHPSG